MAKKNDKTASKSPAAVSTKKASNIRRRRVGPQPRLKFPSRKEGETKVFGMGFVPEPLNYFQKPRQKHSSGSAEWHSRAPYLRQMQRVISTFKPGGYFPLANLANALSNLTIQTNTTIR